MDDEPEQEPSADGLEASEAVESKELEDEELDQAAGGDPGYTHPDAPNPYIP